MSLPADASARKNIPLMTGVLDYFPDALALVAMTSKMGNDQHNPGQPLHWAWEKSTDHADCAIRHLMQRGTLDVDGIPHTAKAAWRILALLQTECVENGAPLPRGARLGEREETYEEAFDEVSGSMLVDRPGTGDPFRLSDLDREDSINATYDAAQPTTAPSPTSAAHSGGGFKQSRSRR
jgi:hypothetical protein